MDSTVLTSIITGSVVVTAAILVWAYVPRRQRLKRFEVRSNLTFDQIYEQFFAAKNLPGELVHEIWNEVAVCLHLPPGKLRPADRFEHELAAPKGWEFDDDIVDVELASQRRLKKCGVQADLGQIKTLGDYVEFFCKLQAQPRQV